VSDVKITMYGPAVYEDHMPSGHTMTVATLAEILAMLPAEAVVLDPPKLIVRPAPGDSSSPSSEHKQDGSPNQRPAAGAETP
jgi:hypothetical protein